MAFPRPAGSSLLEMFRNRAAHPGCLLWMVALLVLAGVVGVWVLVEALDLTAGGEERHTQDGRPTPSRAASLPAPESASPSQPPSDVALWTVVLPERTGGLELAQTGGPELPHREMAMQQDGIPVANLVGGQYVETGGPLVVDFYGGELTGEYDGSAQEMLEATFAANFPNLSPAGGASEHDAGQLGGEVWCVRFDLGVSCGWVDEWTIGYVFVLSGGGPGEVAEVLLGVRADARTQTGTGG